MIRKIIACILVLAMLGTGALAAGNTVLVELEDKNEAVVYLRIFVPGALSSDRVGHYDICIKGKIYFRGKTFTNPCFSYASDSCLRVFNESDTFSVYADNTITAPLLESSIYYKKYTVGGTDCVTKFLKYLNSNISSSSGSRALCCRFKSSSCFHKYKLTSVNCIFAAAYWLYGMGNGSLASVYRAALNGKDSILPEVFIEKHSGDLTKVF